MARNHNEEFGEDAGQMYAYGFDWVVRRYLLRAFRDHIIADGRTLELGCYRGDMTEQILSHVKEITVVEAASELAEIVRSRFRERVTVVTATFEEVQIEQKFDNIFIIHTLEHLDDPVHVLAKARSWLSDDGRLFLAVPNANALSRQIAVKMGLVEFNSAVTPAERAHGHRRTYSIDILLSHAQQAGLRIARSGGVVVKGLANFQFDLAMKHGIVDDKYFDGCDAIAQMYPDLAASVYAVCART